MDIYDPLIEFHLNEHLFRKFLELAFGINYNLEQVDEFAKSDSEKFKAQILKTLDVHGDLFLSRAGTKLDELEE